MTLYPRGCRCCRSSWGGALSMIVPVFRSLGFIAVTPVDFRRSADGLIALVRDAGADGTDPFSGSLVLWGQTNQQGQDRILRRDGRVPVRQAA